MSLPYVHLALAIANGGSLLECDLVQTAELSNINLSELFTQAQPFTRTHISKINPKIKHINRISFEEATALSRLAAENPSRANELYEQANAKYKATIEIKPNDFRAYYNWVRRDSTRRDAGLDSCVVAHPSSSARRVSRCRCKHFMFTSGSWRS